MKVAIMQPYLFPYIGYFQLINSVDTFVIYDDVQWINRGWINRNSILLEGKSFTFTFSKKKGSSRELIIQKQWSDKFGSERESFLKKITIAYSKAPFFDVVYPLIEHCLNQASVNISQYIINTLAILCDYLTLNTRLEVSSRIAPIGETEFRGQNRIIHINKLLNSSEYFNLAGGRNLYCDKDFKKVGISLNFIQPHRIIYPQFGNVFVKDLSIIDALMFNSPHEIKKILSQNKLT